MFKKRLIKLRNHMQKNNIHTSIIMNPDCQFYLTGFRALIYSRPIFVVIDMDTCKLVVPGLEEVHASETANVDEILPYYEHPVKAHLGKTYMEMLRKVVSKVPKDCAIGMDLFFTPGQIINQVRNIHAEVKDVSETIKIMRYVKDESEIAAIKEAGKLVYLGVKETLNICKVGITELEMDASGNQAIYAATSKNYPNAMLDLLVMSPSGPERSILPHVYSNTRKIQEGDVIIHTRQVSLNGYRAELERTVIIGEPNDVQKKAFLAMRKAQQAAMDFIRPGVQAAEVDKIARDILCEEGFAEYAIHRTGHAIGVSLHEPPYLSYDNDLVLKEGMVYTIEPGIYIPGVGGFRHSDTVLLTEGGKEVITEYPRDLEDLTL